MLRNISNFTRHKHFKSQIALFEVWFKTIMHMFSSPLTRSCPYKRKAFFVVQVLFWQQPLWKDSLQITYYWNQHSCQLPVSLLAQLVEHWTGIAEVMGSNPVTMYKLEFFFSRPSFHYCLSSVHYCEYCLHIHVFILSSNLWLSYIHSRLLPS